MKSTFILKNNGGVSLFVNNKPYNITKDHINYEKILEVLKSQDHSDLSTLLDIKKYIIAKAFGAISITTDDKILYKDSVVSDSLAQRIIEMLKQGFDVTPFVLFMENALSNPSKKSIGDLFQFIENNNLPITPDGHFLAYKKVNENYTDCYTGTIDNSIGKSPSMPREKVVADRNVTCAAGLHVCAYHYIDSAYGHSSGPLLVCKVNPYNVVSVPIDYNFSKMRTCGYEVISVIGSNSDKITPKFAGTPTVDHSKPAESDLMKDIINYYADDELIHIRQLPPNATLYDMDDEFSICDVSVVDYVDNIVYGFDFSLSEQLNEVAYQYIEDTFGDCSSSLLVTDFLRMLESTIIKLRELLSNNNSHVFQAKVSDVLAASKPYDYKVDCVTNAGVDQDTTYKSGLTLAVVREIRKLLSEGKHTKAKLGEMYGTSPRTILRIQNFESPYTTE